MNNQPDPRRTRDLMENWKYWARDCPPDPSEIDYYTVSPMFADIMPRGGVPPYDTDSALMVEEVLKRMFVPYRPEWWILLAYYGKGMAQEDIADILGINQSSVSRYRLPAARRIFAEQWAELVRL